MSESVSACLLGYPCAEIVSPGPDRGKEVLCDASERTVRSHQVSDGGESCDQKYDEHGQDAVSENFLLRRPAESLLVTFSPAFKAMRDNILEYSHRADYRAVNSAEKDGNQYQDCHDSHVERQDCRKELDFCQPTEQAGGQA